MATPLHAAGASFPRSSPCPIPSPKKATLNAAAQKHVVLNQLTTQSLTKHNTALTRRRKYGHAFSMVNATLEKIGRQMAADSIQRWFFPSRRTE
jgi:hypothetical protein